jgi:hypothetical protein
MATNTLALPDNAAKFVRGLSTDERDELFNALVESAIDNLKPTEVVELTSASVRKLGYFVAPPASNSPRQAVIPPRTDEDIRRIQAILDRDEPLLDPLTDLD